MTTKPIIFVRFPPGGCGLFLSLVLQWLVDDTELSVSHSGHAQVNTFYQYHNFVDHWSRFRLRVKEFTSLNGDPLSGVVWVKQHFKVSDTPFPYYIVPTHVVNLDAFTTAFPNAKVVNVTFAEANIDQLCYNMAYKSMIEDKNTDVVSRCVRRFNESYPGITVSLENLMDPVFAASIFKLTHLDHFTDLIAYQKPFMVESYNVEFASVFAGRAEWFNGLTEFLTVNVSPSRQQEILDKIGEYGSLQRLLPAGSKLEFAFPK